MIFCFKLAIAIIIIAGTEQFYYVVLCMGGRVEQKGWLYIQRYIVFTSFVTFWCYQNYKYTQTCFSYEEIEKIHLQY